MKITLRQPIKKIYLVCIKLIALHLFTALQHKFIYNTCKMSIPVKEINVCQNTFSYVEITTPRAISRMNYFKIGGCQNEKCPNRDMQNYFNISKQPVSLHKTNVRQMIPVGNTYISYTQTFPQKKFLSQKFFLLVNLFPPSFN